MAATKKKIINGYEITSLTEFRTGGRTASLHPEIPVREITKRLGKSLISRGDGNGDGKVTKEWNVRVKHLATGIVSEFAVWDYKGSRWSGSGDVDAMKAIFGEFNALDDDKFYKQTGSYMTSQYFRGVPFNLKEIA